MAVAAPAEDLQLQMLFELVATILNTVSEPPLTQHLLLSLKGLATELQANGRDNALVIQMLSVVESSQATAH